LLYSAGTLGPEWKEGGNDDGSCMWKKRKKRENKGPEMARRKEGEMFCKRKMLCEGGTGFSAVEPCVFSLLLSFAYFSLFYE